MMDVTSVSAIDGNVLTLGSGASNEGLIGDFGGACWLDSEEYGQVPVTVLRWLSATTAELADPLPHPVEVGNRLVWQLWYAAIAPTASTTRDAITWSVDWSRDRGDNYEKEAVRDNGIAYVTARPFATGCSHRTILQLIPGFGSTVPPNQVSWAPQIRAAEAEVIEWVRGALKPDEVEDQVEARSLVHVHSYLAAAMILDSHLAVGYDRTEAANRYREQAQVRFAGWAQCAQWVDLNGDGVIDDGEEGVDPATISGQSKSHTVDPNYFDSDNFTRHAIDGAR